MQAGAQQSPAGFAEQAPAPYRAPAYVSGYTPERAQADAGAEAALTPAPAPAPAPAPVTRRAEVAAPVAAPVALPVAAPVPRAVAPAPVAAPVEAPRGLPKVRSFELPIADLASIAESSGLQWVNSDATRIASAQQAMAAEVKPVHVPRERPAVAVQQDGPLLHLQA